VLEINSVNRNKKIIKAWAVIVRHQTGKMVAKHDIDWIRNNWTPARKGRNELLEILNNGLEGYYEGSKFDESTIQFTNFLELIPFHLDQKISISFREWALTIPGVTKTHIDDLPEEIRRKLIDMFLQSEKIRESVSKYNDTLKLWLNKNEQKFKEMDVLIDIHKERLESIDNYTANRDKFKQIEQIHAKIPELVQKIEERRTDLLIQSLVVGFNIEEFPNWADSTKSDYSTFQNVTKEKIKLLETEETIDIASVIIQEIEKLCSNFTSDIDKQLEKLSQVEI
jgi:hypothetical protein